MFTTIPEYSGNHFGAGLYAVYSTYLSFTPFLYIKCVNNLNNTIIITTLPSRTEKLILFFFSYKIVGN